MNQVLNLDHAATTTLAPEAREAMARVAAEPLGNPSSAHAAGRRARQLLEDARERVAALLHAETGEVVFTSGATEANNLALFGLAGDPPGRIVAGAIEHPCVIEPLQQLAAAGFELDWLPVGRDGVIAVDDIRNRVQVAPRLLILQLVNHETGAVQRVSEIAGIAGCLVHTDAAQAVGKLPVDFRALGVATMTVSAHKFGGPPGIGALIVRRGVQLRPRMFGGHQQGGRRPGTESVMLAVGMAAALEPAVRHCDRNAETVRGLRALFLERLQPAAPFFVHEAPGGVPHILNVSFPGCAADRLLIALDLAGVACSTGSACSSGSLLPSPVLRAMNLPDELLRSAMRFSFSASTGAPELVHAAASVVEAVSRLRGTPAIK